MRALSSLAVVTAHTAHACQDLIVVSFCTQYPLHTHTVDCWDGPNGTPIITHGNTMCSKIPFEDVVRVIAQHAFDVSDYPLILSLENHCSAPQQEFMAATFKKYFGSMLLDRPLDAQAPQLPSPNDLKRKILLKDRKYADQPRSANQNQNQSQVSLQSRVSDLSTQVRRLFSFFCVCRATASRAVLTTARDGMGPLLKCCIYWRAGTRFWGTHPLHQSSSGAFLTGTRINGHGWLIHVF